MRILASRLVRIALATFLTCAVFSAIAADKPDKKKSQAALLRGKQADEGGHRDQAIAAYTEATQADPTNIDAMRARAKAYQAAGHMPQAQAGHDHPIELEPGGC